MKFKKRKKRPKTHKKRLDNFSTRARSVKRETTKAELPAIAFDPYSEKKRRGRPKKTALNLVTGHAYNFKIRLTRAWPQLEAPLLAAQAEEEVKAAFEKHAPQDAREFVPEFASDILALIRHRKFPKKAEARINFLADSLGAGQI